MEVEIPDSVKQMMNVQQDFIKRNKAVFDTIDRHNNYLQSIYDNSNIQHINSVTTKYDSFIKAIGKNVYITNSSVYNFCKSDYYKNVYSNFYNVEKYIPKYVEADFRFKIQTQKLANQVELLNEKLNNISKPKIDELNVEFDKLISEPLVDASDNNKDIDSDADIRYILAEIYESQKRQEKTFYEEIENRKHCNPSDEPVDKNSNIVQSFLIPLFAFLGVIPIPKEAYEAIVWYVQIISELIDKFF